jgi:2-oxoglutarate dehydrogenase E2 component (dihydrolipoamide succinyltransferase)
MTPSETLAEVVMPRMGASVAEGTVAMWLKAIGDSIVVDEPLLEVSTDKVDTEIPSPVTGVLAEILVPEGEIVPIGARLARVRVTTAAEPASGDGAGQAAPDPPRPPVEAQASAVPPVSSSATAAAATATDRPAAEAGFRRASGSVARLAQQLGVDLSAVTATGPGQRVTREDLLLHVQRSALGRPAPFHAAQPATPASPLTQPGSPATLAAPPEPPGDREHATRMSPMRREIAQRMRHSVDTAVHVTSLIEVDMSSVVAARAREQPPSGGELRPTLLAYVARAVAATLPKTPWLNGQIRGDSIITADYINLGVAVSTEDGKGLLVPVIRNAADLNLTGLAARIADLARRARSRTLSADDLSGATFTITNLGRFGTFGGTPVINAPQVAILGMYAMVKRPVVVPGPDGNDAIGIRPMMNLSMSYDHRLIDGAIAGTFLSGVRAFLENWNDRTPR